MSDILLCRKSNESKDSNHPRTLFVFSPCLIFHTFLTPCLLFQFCFDTRPIVLHVVRSTCSMRFPNSSFKVLIAVSPLFLIPKTMHLQMARIHSLISFLALDKLLQSQLYSTQPQISCPYPSAPWHHGILRIVTICICGKNAMSALDVFLRLK